MNYEIERFKLKVEQFNTLFWLERKWFFAYEFYRSRSTTADELQLIIQFLLDTVTFCIFKQNDVVHKIFSRMYVKTNQ